MSKYWLLKAIKAYPYWGIPLYCRECAFVDECRKPWYKGGKCYNGCIKLKRKRQAEYNEDRWAALLREEEQWGKR